MAIVTTPVKTSGPSARPVGIDELKDQLRITTRDEDALLQRYVAAAIELSEEYLWRQIGAAKYRLSMKRFPKGRYGKLSVFGREDNSIEVERCPVLAIDSITYVDTDGDRQTLDSSKYDFVGGEEFEPALIAPAYGEYWPSVRKQADAVVVTFTAGYGVPSSVDATNNKLTTDGLHNFSDDDTVRVWALSALEESTGLTDYTSYTVINSSGSEFQLSLTSGGSAIEITGESPKQVFVGVPIPERLVNAIQMLAGHFYTTRCANPDGADATDPGVLSFQSLLDSCSWRGPIVR